MTKNKGYMTYATYALVATLGAFLVSGCSNESGNKAAGSARYATFIRCNV